MILENRIKSLAALGQLLNKMSEEEKEELCYKAGGQNAFFTYENINRALDGLILLLDEQALNQWIKHYAIKEQNKNKKVGVIMAGNIPAVGFHDALCVLICGYHLIYKPSSKDTVIIRYIFNELKEIAPEFKNLITEVDKIEIDKLDGIIATGSNNTSRYFEQYFSRIPHIIRRGRTSVAILKGNETEEELQGLVADVFDYFGLGCRSVSKLFVPKEYDFTPFLRITELRTEMTKHSKYFNNYEYHKSILLVNRVPHLDSGTLLLKEDVSEASPMSVLHYETYENIDQLKDLLKSKKEILQCVVENGEINFGCSQKPGLMDYADDVDTMSFLTAL